MACALALLVVVSSIVLSRPAQPAAASLGIDFSIGTDIYGGAGGRCDSSGSPTDVCNIPLGAKFNVNVLLHSLPPDLPGGDYGGFQADIVYSGVTATKTKSSLHLNDWPGCALPAPNFTPGHVQFGCAIGPGAPESTYTGRMLAPEFTCAADGIITLVHGSDKTSIVDDVTFAEFSETRDESLTIHCVPPQAYPGDADADGAISSLDALLILQFEAGLLPSLPSPENADANHDGAVNALDAQLVLQIAAGLIPTPSPVP